MRTPFAVGRLSGGTAEIVVLDREADPPFPGPWRIHAVVRDRRPREPAPLPGTSLPATVH